MTRFLLREGCTHTVVSIKYPVESGINTTQLLMQNQKASKVFNFAIHWTGLDPSWWHQSHTLHACSYKLTCNRVTPPRDVLFVQPCFTCGSHISSISHTILASKIVCVWLLCTRCIISCLYTHHTYTNSCACIILQHSLYLHVWQGLTENK